MKKILKTLTLTLVCLIVCISAAACTFIKTEGSGNQTTDGNNSSGNKEYNSSTTVTDIGNVDIVYRKVKFNYNDIDYATATPLEQKAAIKKVERSSVAISVADGAGSGVVIDINLLNDGGTVADEENTIYVLTCHHVISDKGNITVQFPDENCRYEDDDFAFTGVIGGKISDNVACAVTLIGGDVNSDIALLKVDLGKTAASGKELSDENKTAIRNSKVKVAGDGYINSGKFVTGEEVFSIGNPTGLLPGTVSVGTISYLERTTSVSDIGEMSLLQIDLTSNPGNSGGGLYNFYGDLIGITNAGNTNYQNINFAIPFVLSNDAEETKGVYGTVNHGFKYCAEMLLSTASSTNYGCVPESKQKFGFTVTEQAQVGGTYILVASVTDGGLAATAGLKANDIITKISVTPKDGEAYEKSVSTVSEFSAIMKNLNIGDKFVLQGQRQSSYNRYTSFATGTITCSQFWFCFIAQ